MNTATTGVGHAGVVGGARVSNNDNAEYNFGDKGSLEITGRPAPMRPLNHLPTTGQNQ